MTGEIPTVQEAPPVYATEAPQTERVPPGYRQTGVGVIPEDWQIVPLSDLFDFRNGVNADKSAYGQGTPFINVLEVITHTHLRGSDIPGRVTLPRSLVDSYAVHRGDILFNRTSETQEEVGLASVYLGDATVVFGGFVIRGRSREAAIDDIYSGYAFRSPIIRSQIISKGQGAVRANIGQQELSKVLAVLPPLSEQRAIATALSDVDTLISALDKLIAKKRAIKTAAMRQLLTGKQRLPGFNGEWANVELQELGSFSKGKGIKKDEVVSDGIPCVRYGEIYTLHHDYIKEFHSFIPASVVRRSQRIRRGDLLFTGSGETIEEIGKCVAYLRDQEAYAGGDIVIFSPVRDDSMFLGYLMNHSSVVAQKASMGQGDAVVHISARNLARLRFALPPVEEQTAIATVLSDMDAEISALEARREKTRQVKQGMMHELLTGRIRLKDKGDGE